MITSFSSGNWSSSRGWTRIPSGTWMWPSERAMLVFLRIERPTRQTLRPSASAARTTCCTRWMFEAKLVTTTRPLQRAKRACSSGPTIDSLAAQPGQPRDVGRRAADRRLVELVVAGDQHGAELGAQRYRAHVGDRVRQVDQLDRERPGVRDLAGREHLDRGLLELVLVELGAR